MGSETIAPADPERLAAVTTGEGVPRVALVHGFSQTRDCLGPLADDLAVDHQVVRVDAPGHGGSLDHRASDLFSGARLLARTVGRAVYVGYSMGGRLCLHAALEHPEHVEQLVLIGATAGIEDDRDRVERRRSDAQLAARLEHVGVDAFLEDWLALPMFRGLPDWARFDDQRRTNTVEGLAASLRHAGTGTMTPLWDRLFEIRCPVLLVTGEHDDRYRALAERMLAGFGGPAHHQVIPDAGHAVHLEQPDATVGAIRSFLRAR